MPERNETGLGRSISLMLRNGEDHWLLIHYPDECAVNIPTAERNVSINQGRSMRGYLTARDVAAPSPIYYLSIPNDAAGTL